MMQHARGHTWLLAFQTLVRLELSSYCQLTADECLERATSLACTSCWSILILQGVIYGDLSTCPLCELTTTRRL